MNILDRMLFAAFIRSYFICLVSTLSLYIVLDLFSNLDDFGIKSNALPDVIANIVNYYSYRSVQFYDRLCEAIALLAAVFTVAWMQRNNEMLPILSAGVSTHRILRPILLGAALMLGLGVANQELLIPRIAEQLTFERDDLEGQKDLPVYGAYDSNGVHLEGQSAVRKDLTVKNLNATLPETPASSMIHLSASSATYVPPDDHALSGGWLLTGTMPADIEAGYRPDMLISILPGKYFIRTRDANFESMTRHPKWNVLASTSHLYELLNKPDAPRQGAIAVLFHSRFSRPVIGMLLVILGLSIILRDQSRHMFISAGICLVMCGTFFGVVLVSKFLGENDYFSPSLAAWFPALLFGPVALVQYDAIHT